MDVFGLTDQKKRVMDFMDGLARVRNSYIEKNRYYYEDLIRFFKYTIPEGSSVLEIGCGTGHILNALNPDRGVGIDISLQMIEAAKHQYPHLRFFHMDAENLEIDGSFDYILISDTLGYLEDIQKALQELWKVSHPDTRIILTYHNFLWQPLLVFAEKVKLKMPQMRLNWLNHEDIHNVLNLEWFEIIKRGRRFIVPKYIPGISWLCNRYLSQIPLFNIFGITGYTIARPFKMRDEQNTSVSIIIPARNERGNIENAVRRCPQMGSHTEIIFVEGHSQDGTLDEIQQICEKYSGTHDVKYAVQDGKGKGNAVRTGFAMARGDILMIQDADLTAPPEDLPKFYHAIATGKGEYINGSRLVYPMEDEAMRTLNMYANKFFSVMFSWLLGQPMKDTLCGTKVIRRMNWDRISANRKYFGEFDPFGDFDLIFGAAKLNLKIVEVPVRYQARQYGETNISRYDPGTISSRN
jgi:SAM-dependent methyltransferase